MTRARADARPRGNIEARGDSLRIRVYAGPDPVTGKPVYLRETVHGTDDAARRTARRALNRLVAEAEKARKSSSVISLGRVIDEWLRVAEHEDSTRETYLGYIERTIKPALGSMSIAKLSVRHLETLYAELRLCGCGAAGSSVTASSSSSTRPTASTIVLRRSARRTRVGRWLPRRCARSTHCRAVSATAGEGLPHCASMPPGSQPPTAKQRKSSAPGCPNVTPDCHRRTASEGVTALSQTRHKQP
jgi:hypothetical protein